MKVLVLGLGYVGSAMAACLTRSGHAVVGIDSNASKLRSFDRGRSPVREPGVEELLAAARERSRLSTAVAVADHALDADVAVVCVGTPARSDGGLEMGFVLAVAEELGTAVRRRPPGTRPLLCVFRSTMLPGSIEALVIPAMTRAAGAAPGRQYEVAFNPEFLRESMAIADYFQPAKIVVGEREKGATQRLLGLYADIDAPFFEVTFRLAEMIKMVDNAFHALKVSFANEVGRLAAAAAVDEQQLLAMLIADRKLNISDAYLRPGAPFGGSCLPKDVAALCHFARRHDVELPVIRHVLPSNAAHLQAWTQRVLDALPPGAAVLLTGVTFKAGTDDLRQSPLVHLARRLLSAGCRLQIFDQDLIGCDLVGDNLQFVRRRLPELFDLLTEDLEQALRANPIVIRAKSLPVPIPAGLQVIDLDEL